MVTVFLTQGSVSFEDADGVEVHPFSSNYTAGLSLIVCKEAEVLGEFLLEHVVGYKLSFPETDRLVSEGGVPGGVR